MLNAVKHTIQDFQASGLYQIASSNDEPKKAKKLLHLLMHQPYFNLESHQHLADFVGKLLVLKPLSETVPKRNLKKDIPLTFYDWMDRVISNKAFEDQLTRNHFGSSSNQENEASLSTLYEARVMLALSLIQDQRSDLIEDVVVVGNPFFGDTAARPQRFKHITPDRQGVDLFVRIKKEDDPNGCYYLPLQVKGWLEPRPYTSLTLTDAEFKWIHSIVQSPLTYVPHKKPGLKVLLVKRNIATVQSRAPTITDLKKDLISLCTKARNEPDKLLKLDKPCKECSHKEIVEAMFKQGIVYQPKMSVYQGEE